MVRHIERFSVQITEEERGLLTMQPRGQFRGLEILTEAANRLIVVGSSELGCKVEIGETLSLLFSKVPKCARLLITIEVGTVDDRKPLLTPRWSEFRPSRHSHTHRSTSLDGGLLVGNALHCKKNMVFFLAEARVPACSKLLNKRYLAGSMAMAGDGPSPKRILRTWALAPPSTPHCIGGSRKA